jgi:predicted Zn-dependent peptidase
MKRSLLCGAALVAAVLVLPGRARGGKVDIPFQKYALPNGLEVILHRDPRVPVVHVQVWYHVGSKDEKAGKTGFAHLFEHMMFQASRNIEEDTFFKHLQRVGGYGVNGTTNTDRTNYFESVPRNHLELALWLESDRMGFLLEKVTDPSFRVQQDVVRNERRQSYETQPYGLIWKAFSESLYPPSHPYHHTVIGEHEDLARATVEDVKGFFRRYYAPGNATLTIAGDIDLDRTRGLVEKYFGTLPKLPAPIKQDAPPVKEAAVKTVAMEANVQLPRFVYAWPSPRKFGAHDAELDVLGDILGGGKTSRLYRKLVYELRIAQSVSVDQDGSELGGDFSVDVTAKPGKSFDDIRKLVDQQI